MFCHYLFVISSTGSLFSPGNHFVYDRSFYCVLLSTFLNFSRKFFVLFCFLCLILCISFWPNFWSTNSTVSISFLQHGYFKSVLRATISGVIEGFCCFYWFSFTLSCLLLCLVAFCCVWDIVFLKIICKNILKPEMMLRSSR